jgi:hypothetical protein
MADIAKVKRNIQRMIDQNAPESDIDAYVASEGTTPEELRAAGPSAPELSYGETAMDMLKSAGSGLVTGGEMLVGGMGDAQQATGDAMGWLTGKMGMSPENQQRASSIAQRMAIPGIVTQAPRTPMLKQGVEAMTGPQYETKTTAGDYARTIGEFAPNALLGPGGMGRKAAMTVIPALAAEGGSKLAEATGNPELAPYAKVGGALLGGVAAAGRGNAPMKKMIKDAPDVSTVASMTKQAYDKLDDAKIVFDPKAYKSTAMKIQTDLRKHGLLVEDTGDIASTLKDIVARAKKVNGWNEVDAIRKRLGKIASSTNPDNATDAARASIIVKHLDDLVDSGKTMSLKGVSRDKIPGMVDEARELGRRNILGRQIGEMDRKSEFYVSGAESGQRNQFGSYLRSSKGKGLTEAERAAFKKVTNREGLLNVLTTTGGRMNQAIGPSAGGVLGFLGGGPVGALLGAGGSYAAHLGTRKVMEHVTDKQVKNALATVMAGKKAQISAMSAAEKEKLQSAVRTLLAIDSAERSPSTPLLGR